MNRRWLISVSLVAHLGLGILLFATGVWRIQRLDGGRADLALAVMLPPAAQEGGPPPGEKPKDARKKTEIEKKLVKNLQPEPKALEATPIASTLPGTGEGSGSGSGIGSGSGSSPTPCDDCIDDRTPVDLCGNGTIENDETCDDGNHRDGDGCSKVCTKEARKVSILPPTVFRGLRISGETQIEAPDVVKTQMLRDGNDRTVGTLKICIATDGGISSVSVASSTKYSEYDAKLVAAARRWRYRAYLFDGSPMPACSAVTFVYTIK